ncbi:MAG: IS4 family transposase, partial [Opitutales bacterium]
MKKKKRKKKKKSSVRHTRAVKRALVKQPIAPPPDEEIKNRFAEILLPAIDAQKEFVKKLGLRSRSLTLRVMVAIVVSVIWRQLPGGGSEISRLLVSEGLLWVVVMKVSQQAISERLRTFPPIIFLRIFQSILPVLRKRWQERDRPLPPPLAWATKKYKKVLSVDGSTLDALERRVGLLRGQEKHPLAGKMMGLLDLSSWLPYWIWYEEKPTTSEQNFWTRILLAVPKGALLLFDLGFTNFGRFADLTQKGVTFITRAKSNLSFDVEKVLFKSQNLVDLVIWIGEGKTRQRVRLIKACYKGQWHSYITNELDPDELPAAYVVALYYQRWTIEDAYNIVKRLLGLAYFWNGSQNGVQLQLWATWIIYAILVDMTDDVAQLLGKRFLDISIERVFKSLYYFAQALERGEANDPIDYLAKNAKWLGIIKSRRRRARDQVWFW